MIEDQAIVVHRSPYSETSYLVTWLTLDHGILRTLARGAARPKQPLFGKIDLHHVGDLGFSFNKSSHLHRVTAFEPNLRHTEVGRHYDRSLCAAYFFQVIETLVEREHPVPELYDIYLKALGYLETHQPDWTVVERFEKRVFHLLGIHHPEQGHDLLRRTAMPRLPRTFPKLRELFRPSP